MSIPAFRHTYQATIHYLVKYKCCSCGSANVDKEQAFSVTVREKARSEDELCSRDNEMIQQLKQMADGAVRNKQEDINRRRYTVLGLECRCPECGKMQPWSGFRSVWGMFLWVSRMYKNPIKPTRYLFVVLGMAYVFGLAAFLQARPAVGFAMLILPFIPSAAVFIRNSIFLILSRKLDDEHQPEISITRAADHYTIIQEKSYDGEVYEIASDENELKSYEKKMTSDIIWLIYGVALIAAALIIPNTPAATFPFLQTIAGAFRSVLPILVGFSFLDVLAYRRDKKRYDELQKQMEQTKGKLQKEQTQAGK